MNHYTVRLKKSRHGWTATLSDNFARSVRRDSKQQALCALADIIQKTHDQWKAVAKTYDQWKAVADEWARKLAACEEALEGIKNETQTIET